MGPVYISIYFSALSVKKLIEMNSLSSDCF